MFMHQVVYHRNNLFKLMVTPLTLGAFRKFTQVTVRVEKVLFENDENSREPVKIRL